MGYISQIRPDQPVLPAPATVVFTQPKSRNAALQYQWRGLKANTLKK